MQAKTKRVKYVMTYIKENTNINEHRRVIVKLNNKSILKSAYRDTIHEKKSVAHFINENKNYLLKSFDSILSTRGPVATSKTVFVDPALIDSIVPCYHLCH